MTLIACVNCAVVRRSITNVALQSPERACPVCRCTTFVTQNGQVKDLMWNNAEQLR